MKKKSQNSSSLTPGTYAHPVRFTEVRRRAKIYNTAPTTLGQHLSDHKGTTVALDIIKGGSNID